MNFANRVHQAALRLIDLLEESGTPYALMGGLAVPIWAIPRATFDIDLVLSVDESGLRDFLETARTAEFQVDPPFESGFRDVIQGMEKIRIEWWTPESRRVEIDVFLVSTPYQEAAFARRARVGINGRQTWVLSAADLILHKLVAGRPKDAADVQSILAVQGVPDEAYLREWAARLGVSAALHRAIDDVGGGPEESSSDE